MCIFSTWLILSSWNQTEEWGASLFLFWQEQFLHFSQGFTLGVFRHISVKCGEIVLQLMTLHFVTCLVDVFTQISLPPSQCFPLRPFNVFLGSLLLVHKCGKYWLNVSILASYCSSVMSWIWQTILQLNVSVTDILFMQTLDGMGYLVKLQLGHKFS